MHRLSTSEKDRALHRARAFESKNPFIMIVMQPSYIHPGKGLVSFQFKNVQLKSLLHFLDNIH